MSGLSWFWIGLQLAMPPAVGWLIAWLFWRMDQPIFGNLAGSVVLFGSAFALIMRGHVEIDRAVRQCLDQDFTCWPEPSAFTRFAIYAFIGLIEVFALFTMSLKMEERARRRNYSREWQ